MALFNRDFHSFSTSQEHTPQQGWDWCMSKADCKWPVIVAIIVGIVISIFTLYCCLRCCGCCGSRRGRRRENAQPSGFNPLAYQGYAPAGAPAPGYGPEPPRYAQFDANTRKVGEDSLPAMPTWSQGQDKKVFKEEAQGDVEMGRMDPQKNDLIENNNNNNNNSTADLSHRAPQPPQQQGYTDLTKHEPYTGPDFNAVDTSYGGVSQAASIPAHPEPYTGPDFGHGAGQPAYSPYAPSTRYEPSHGNEPQEFGTTYSNALPPPSPSAQQTGFGAVQHAPSVLQAGRRPGPGAPPPEGYRDV